MQQRLLSGVQERKVRAEKLRRLLQNRQKRADVSSQMVQARATVEHKREERLARIEIQQHTECAAESKKLERKRQRMRSLEETEREIVNNLSMSIQARNLVGMPSKAGVGLGLMNLGRASRSLCVESAI